MLLALLLPITDNTPYTACIACKRRYCYSAAKHTPPFYLLSSPTTTFVTVSGRAHPCGTGTTGSTFRRDNSSAAVMRSSSWSARWSRCPFAHGTMPRIHSRSFRNWRLYRWLMHDPPNFRNGNSTKGKHLTRAGSCEGHGHTMMSTPTARSTSMVSLRTAAAWFRVRDSQRHSEGAPPKGLGRVCPCTVISPFWYSQKHEPCDQSQPSNFTKYDD